MNNIAYVCPRCRGRLDARQARYECTYCAGVYPILAGIPDFRLYPDPYIGLEADRAKGLALDAQDLSFPDLVRHYYAITPEVTPEQAAHFTEHHLAGEARGRAVLRRAAHYRLAVEGRRLDLGCGTGGLMAAGGDIIGVDIAFRWLVVARRRLREAGIDARLVCACADYLPFPNESFDLIFAENVLEHTADAAGVLREAARVRAPSGSLTARTVNRFALAPEPHVHVWGVGFLPRRWMNAYVRRVKGIAYEHIHLRSQFGWRSLLCASGWAHGRVQAPYLTPADSAHQSPVRRRLFALYGGLNANVPPLRPLLTLVGPYLDIVAS